MEFWDFDHKRKRAADNPAAQDVLEALAAGLGMFTIAAGLYLLLWLAL